jgi:hypothetical protein
MYSLVSPRWFWSPCLFVATLHGPPLTHTTFSRFFQGLSDFHNIKAKGVSKTYDGHDTAIGFNACGNNGGVVYSKMSFSSTQTITFDFAGLAGHGALLGYSDGTPGTAASHVWPIATQDRHSSLFFKITPGNNMYSAHQSMRVGFELSDGSTTPSSSASYSMFGCYTGVCSPMLDSTSAWAVTASNIGDYMVIEIPTISSGVTLTRIGTQGRSGGDQWVTAYSLHVSLGDATGPWTKVEGDRNDGLFTGNSDQNTKVWHNLALSGVVIGAPRTS